MHQDRDGVFGGHPRADAAAALGLKDVAREESVDGDRAVALSFAGSRREWHGGCACPTGCCLRPAGRHKDGACWPAVDSRAPSHVLVSSSSSPPCSLQAAQMQPLPPICTTPSFKCISSTIFYFSFLLGAGCLAPDAICWHSHCPEHRGRFRTLCSRHGQMLPFLFSWVASFRLWMQLDASPLSRLSHPMPAQSKRPAASAPAGVGPSCVPT